MKPMTPSPPPSKRYEAQPRWATPRRPDRPTWGGRIAKIAELLGTPLMPWQRAAVDVAGEYDPATGIPYYREVNLVVMRQQGKTTIELAATTDRFVSWKTPQRVVYSAQTGGDARKKLLEDWAPALTRSRLASLVDQVVRANGHESIRWDGGSFVETMASLEASGHGFTRDLGFVDEAWKDQDERREGSIRPAQLTIPDAQLWVVSTAGNDGSVYLRRKVEAGRAAAVEDRGAGICYVEYSVPEDEDPYDLDVLTRYMPALCPTPGPCTCSDAWRHTVTHEVLQAEQQGMDRDEYLRAYGNQWRSGAGERVIPQDLYQMVCSPDAKPEGRLTIGVDVLPDRSAGSVAVHGQGVVELVEAAPGTGWMVPLVKAMVDKHGGTVKVDGQGPAASVADDLEAEGVRVDRLSSGEVAAACARVYDGIADRKITIRTSSQVDTAVGGVAKKPQGDRFVWSRSSSPVDITPLYAVTLAVSGGEPPKPFFFVS